MSRHDLVWQSFLPLESIKLGRFVLNPDEPYQDYLDPACDLTPEILKRPQLRYLDVQNTAKTTGLAAELTSLVSASRSKQKTKLVAVTTEQSTIYQLANSGQWYNAALKDQETREWIDEVNGTGEEVYVMVGYQTMVDATVCGDMARLKNFQARLQLPVSEAASATGAVATIGDVADPGLDMHGRRDDDTRTQFVAAGEQIYAVQYRKVRFRWI